MPHYKIVYQQPDDDPESTIVFSRNIKKRFTSMQQEKPKVEFISCELIHLQDPKILDLLQKAGPLRAVEICQTLHVSLSKVYSALRRLKQEGLIQGRKGRAESQKIFYEIRQLEPLK